jgi:hypothetical protein
MSLLKVVHPFRIYQPTETHGSTLTGGSFSSISEFFVQMMEAVRTSETSICYNENTWGNIPEGSNLHRYQKLVCPPL